MFQPALTLTVHNAKTVLEAGLRAIASGQTKIDLMQVTTVDSIAVATLLAWQRAAREREVSLVFSNLPSSLHSLILLYDVADLLELEIAVNAVPSSAQQADVRHH